MAAVSFLILHVFPATEPSLGFMTIGCRKPKRRIDAATCGTAGSFLRGFAGEQKRRSIGTVSTVSFVVVSKRVVLHREPGLEGGAWDWPGQLLREIAHRPGDGYLSASSLSATG